MGCKPSKPSKPSSPSSPSKLSSLSKPASASSSPPNNYCKKHYTRIGCERHLSPESPCKSICANGNDCKRCRHMRDSRREHLVAVLKRVNAAKNADSGIVEQRDLGDGQVGEGETDAVSGDVENKALEDGMENVGLEEDIADHNVWA